MNMQALRRAVAGVEQQVLGLRQRRQLRSVVVLLGAAVGGFTVLGTLYALTDLPIPWYFNLGAEYTMASLWSSMLLIGAGAMALMVRQTDAARLSAVGLAALFILMGADEMFAFHETMEQRSGIDWQILYAPVIVLAAVSWLHLVIELRRRLLPSAALICGAVAWGVSQVLEAVQWDGDEPRAGYVYMMLTEEVLEMSGSTLFLIGLSVVYFAAQSDSRKGGGRVTEPLPVMEAKVRRPI